MENTTPASAGPITRDDDRAVIGFLEANPNWLASHPELYRRLAPPNRVHGETLADHMAAMVLRERRHADAMTEQTEAVLASGRAALTMLARVHDAVLALIAADDPAECLIADLPRILVVDAIAVCRHRATAERMLGAEDSRFRTAPPDAATLYREAAALACHDLLIRLPGVGLIGLASRDALEPVFRPARRHLLFLGQVVASLLPGRDRFDRPVVANDRFAP